MKHLITVSAIAAAVLLAAYVEAQAPVQLKPIPLYIPFGAYYMNGKFVKLVPFDDAETEGGAQTRFDSLKECTEAQQRAVLAAQQLSTVPAGGTLLGVCIPVPAWSQVGKQT